MNGSRLVLIYSKHELTTSIRAVRGGIYPVVVVEIGSHRVHCRVSVFGFQAFLRLCLRHVY